MIRDAERPGLHSHAERGNDQQNPPCAGFCLGARKAPHPSPPETSDRPEGEGTEWGMLK
jgi:hypothetical protein